MFLETVMLDYIHTSFLKNLCAWVSRQVESKVEMVDFTKILHYITVIQWMAIYELDFLKIFDLMFIFCSIAPPTFTQTPPPLVEGLVGSHLSLPCVANGNPPPTITWLKDGSVIERTNYQVCVKWLYMY